MCIRARVMVYHRFRKYYEFLEKIFVWSLVERKTSNLMYLGERVGKQGKNNISQTELLYCPCRWRWSIVSFSKRSFQVFCLGYKKKCVLSSYRFSVISLLLIRSLTPFSLQLTFYVFLLQQLCVASFILFFSPSIYSAHARELIPRSIPPSTGLPLWITSLQLSLQSQKNPPRGIWIWIVSCTSFKFTFTMLLILLKSDESTI